MFIWLYSHFSLSLHDPKYKPTDLVWLVYDVMNSFSHVLNTMLILMLSKFPRSEFLHYCNLNEKTTVSMFRKDRPWYAKPHTIVELPTRKEVPLKESFYCVHIILHHREARCWEKTHHEYRSVLVFYLQKCIP